MVSQAGRLRHLARILAGERKVTTAARSALDGLLTYAGRALTSSGYDASVLSVAASGWRDSSSLAGLLGDVESVFLSSWGATARGSTDPEAYALRHLEAVTNRLSGVPDTVFDNIRTALGEGRQANESIDQLSARVSALLGDEDRWAGRARTIARTETIAANNAGATGAAYATAAVLGEDPAWTIKEWLATEDSRTRRTHKDADGQMVMGLDVPFRVGSSKLDHPGDPSGAPEETVNCRCAVMFIYPGDPEYAAAIEGNGLRDPGTSTGTSGAAPVEAEQVTIRPGVDLGMGVVIHGMSIAPTAATPVATAVRAAEVAVDAGPTTLYEFAARQATIQELQTMAAGVGKTKAAAKAELRRRGITASAGTRTNDALTAEVVALMTQHLTAVTDEANPPPPETRDDPLTEVAECTCCGGPGEHTCGHECYVCDSAGTRSAQMEASAGLVPGDPIVCEGHHGRPDPCNDGRQPDECQHDPDPVSPDAPPTDTPTMEAAVTTTPPEAGAPVADPTHAGLAVWAADTERVLMLQRALDPTDAPDVAGTWEFPGGGIEDGETPQQGAEREFTEETGLPVPAGDITNGWRSDDGVYQGFVLTVPTEATAFAELNPDLAAAESVNPDDPERTNPDVTAWFTLEQVQGLGPALRPEVHNTPWDVFTTPATPAPEEAPVAVEPDTMTTAQRVTTAISLRAKGESWASVANRLGYADDTAARAALLAFAEGDVPAEVPATVPVVNPEDAPALAQDIAPDGEPFYGIACPEDVMSGDGRLFSSGAITWRDLPLPLMVQDAQMPGHDGAVRAGRLDVLERDESGAKPMIRYAGVWDTSPVAVEARRQVAAGVARGVSVDCDAVEVQVTYTGSDGQVLDPAVDEFPEDGVVNEVETATAARISGLTICSIPAFHQAYIANGVLADRTEPEPGMAEVNGETMPVEVVPEDAVAASAAGNAPMPAWSLVASGGAIVVPADAFVRPDALDLHETGTPLTVTADGRVYGHLATWGTCHIGISGLCQEPPASATNYAYFATGAVLTDAGDLQPVGHLTMETGHAGLRLGHHAAVSHYDNTGTAVADVAMGQDHIGIWYAGVVRPGVTESQVYALRASGKASGDWRPIGGGLELVAALVVNTEGFPVPRPAIAASGGQVHALVAAGMVTTARPAETPHDIHAIAAAAVRTALDRRDRRDAARIRLAARREYARRTRVAAAVARLTERV